jgi:hypothetical protein
MSILNFEEIPQANHANGKQDEFELFARDFFAYLGYQIISEPDRGQDGGKDILIQEIRKGIAGETKLLWLVSCKHFAHSKSGKSVGVDDEINISDRVRAFKCQGFIGFYSTVVSSGLNARLADLVDAFKVYHRGNIEEALLRDQEGMTIARRYFPKSMEIWDKSNNLAENRSIINEIPELDNIRQQYYDEYIQRKKIKQD